MCVQMNVVPPALRTQTMDQRIHSQSVVYVVKVLNEHSTEEVKITEQKLPP